MFAWFADINQDGSARFELGTRGVQIDCIEVGARITATGQRDGAEGYKKTELASRISHVNILFVGVEYAGMPKHNWLAWL